MSDPPVGDKKPQMLAKKNTLSVFFFSGAMDGQTPTMTLLSLSHGREMLCSPN